MSKYGVFSGPYFPPFVLTLENQRFSDVFAGHRKKPVAWDGLSANPTKLSSTIKKNRRLLPTNCLNVFDNFLGLAFEGLILTRNFDEIRKFTRHCPPLPYSERMESNAELKKFVFRIVKHSVSDCFLILGIHVWTYCTNGSLPFISIGRRDY